MSRPHKRPATQTVHQVTEALEGDTPYCNWLWLLQTTMNKKLKTIKKLDAKIVDLIEDKGNLADKTKQTDTHKETL